MGRVNFAGRETAAERSLRYHERMAMILADEVAQQAELLNMLNVAVDNTAIGEDPIIRFKLKFPSNDRWYTYCFINVAGAWYGTGPRAPKSFSDEDLVRWMSENEIAEFYYVTEMEGLA